MYLPRLVIPAPVFALIACASPALGADRYPPASFNDFYGGTLNISVFTFRDLDRDGKYDLGDLPMSGILVDAVSAELPDRTRRSNGSGFANFEMSATDLGSDIPLAGPYTFSVVVPDGWQVTTGNAVQESRFVLLPGAPADLFADPPPLRVGLAPDRTISGRVEDGSRTARRRCGRRRPTAWRQTSSLSEATSCCRPRPGNGRWLSMVGTGRSCVLSR